MQSLAQMWKNLAPYKQKSTAGWPCSLREGFSLTASRGFIANVREGYFAKCGSSISDAATCLRGLHCIACTVSACGFVEGLVNCALHLGFGFWIRNFQIPQPNLAGSLQC
jgi:hypothetical protein